MSTVNAAFAQTNPSFGEINENVEKAISLIENTNFDLIVFPELFNTGYAFTSKREAISLSEKIPDGSTCKKLMKISSQKKNTIVAGLAELYGEKSYNSAVVVSNGKYIGRYRKLHLFNKEKLWFSPGNLRLKVYDLKTYRLGVMICFDWIFPEVARTLSLMGADIIAHPSNLVLPDYCQNTMFARAIENKVFTITANRVGEERRGKEYFCYTGRSIIISPKMKCLASATNKEVVCKSAKLNISLAKNKKITLLNDILNDRRPKFYMLS